MVLAGSRPGAPDPVAASEGVAHKVLAVVGGQTLLERVVRALREYGVAEVAVSANNPAVEAEAMKAAREIAALPPQGVLASRRLMRGSPDEIVARIDEEAELFKTRLKSAEARAAFEAFMTRKK